MTWLEVEERTEILTFLKTRHRDFHLRTLVTSAARNRVADDWRTGVVELGAADD
jgi:hypothetical protein